MYTIDPDERGAFRVRCDMTSSPGRGWTIFQMRIDGSEDFYREWSDYKNGFGNLTGEFWLGLDKIHRLTASGQNVLRVDLESFENERRYAIFKTFFVGNETEDYILNVGQYTGKNVSEIFFILLVSKYLVMLKIRAKIIQKKSEKFQKKSLSCEVNQTLRNQMRVYLTPRSRMSSTQISKP